MRLKITFFLLTCGAAFGQVNVTPPPDDTPQRLNDNLRNDIRQRLGDILNAGKVQLPASAFAPQALTTMTAFRAGGECSIPLLNAASPEKTVPMPKLTPPGGAPRRPGMVKPLDRMSVVAPAPACPAAMARSSAPPAVRQFVLPPRTRILPVPRPAQ